MGRIRSKNTTPEMLVRKLLFSMGYRYRIHRKDLPGTPDIALFNKKKAIFVHGCFWHLHTGCKVSHIPKTNSDFWHAKLQRNHERDILNQMMLIDSGWNVLVIWECQIKDLGNLREKLSKFLSD
jgi:DNA mismatch endonuclease (patch repair protein)